MSEVVEKVKVGSVEPVESNKVIKLKAEIFDLMRKQENLQMGINQLEKIKREKVQELLKLEEDKK